MSAVTCSLCDLVLSHASVLSRHVTGRRCKERQLARTLFARGLYPVEFRWQAKSDHATEALRAFGLDVELHATGGRTPQSEGGGVGNEAWTSEEGVALALIIEEAARLIGLSYPEAARRMLEHKELIGPFGVAWKLGDKSTKDTSVFIESDDKMLRQILKSIDYDMSSNGKPRARIR